MADRARRLASLSQSWPPLLNVCFSGNCGQLVCSVFAIYRPKNGDVRTREHLTIDEVERLIEAAKTNRYGHRDALMMLLAFRHGLRPGEIVDLRWDQV